MNLECAVEVVVGFEHGEYGRSGRHIGICAGGGGLLRELLPVVEQPRNTALFVFVSMQPPPPRVSNKFTVAAACDVLMFGRPHCTNCTD